MVIAAAFIGPGTVTTAAASGARFGYGLLWALLFSTLACAVLQESAARITIASGKTLGQAVKHRFKNKSVAWFMAISIFLGCAAYEAGNILGAISGMALAITGVNPAIFTIIIVAVCAAVLWLGKTSTVANIMGVVVAVMGFAFLVVGLSTPIDGASLTRGLLVPTFPEGSIILTLGLVGTTIVPYNLFLGSGLARGHTLKSMRFGLIVAVLLGGVISMGILLAGSAMTTEFSFEGLAQTLSEANGTWMAGVFAIGLFAAGFTSSITAPLAAAITLQSVGSAGRDWSEKSTRYRMGWGLVLLTGLVFGVTGIKPVPVIILAQAANGLILPVIAVFLWLICNNKGLMGAHTNAIITDILMAITVWVSSLLGFINVFKAAHTALGEAFVFEGSIQTIILILATLVTILSGYFVVKERGSVTVS
jgi:Mn2+/Fe2+ NRAMP family transporter